MKTVELHTPLTEDDVRGLEAGDKVFLTGEIYTARDAAHKRLVKLIEDEAELPFDLNGAVMASDAFFPFPDCVEIAHGAGITAVVQPGGSIRDKDSIEYCNSVGMSMVTTGIRHFKH